MKLLLFILLPFFSIFRVNSQITTCPDNKIFEKPQNEPFITWFPNDFSSSGAPWFPSGCSSDFNIHVPQGWSARIILTVNVTNPYQMPMPVTVTDQRQSTETVSSADRIYYYFIAPGGKINLDTMRMKVQFGFKVDWEQYPTSSPIQIQVNQSDTLPYMLSNTPSGIYSIYADTKASMTVISYPYDFYYMFLRGVFIYFGPDTNSPIYRTGYDLWYGRSQAVSSSDQMTVLILSRENAPILPMLLWQDYSNTQGIKHFKGVTCSSGAYCGVYEMDATNGPVAIQTIYSSNYVEADVLTSFEGAGTLEVFIGGVTKDKKNSIAMYNAQTSAPYLPQKFLGPLKTYVLLNGKAKMNLTRDYDEFGITKKFGRKGFITTAYYTELSKGQHGNGEIMVPIGYSEAKFKVKVGYADMTGNTVFWIDGMKNGTETSDNFFNSTCLPDTKNGYGMTGDTLEVYYDSQNSATNGMFLRFEVTQP